MSAADPADRVIGPGYIAGIPPDVLGEGAKPTVIADHGPYFVYSPGEAIHRVDQRDSVPHLWGGLVAMILTAGEWIDSRMAPENTQYSREVTYHVGPRKAGIEKFAADYALAVKDRLIRDFGKKEVIVLERFSRLAPDIVRLDDLNRLIAPRTLAYEWISRTAGQTDDVPPERRREWDQTKRDPEIAAMVKKDGALAVRRMMMAAGLDALNTRRASHPKGEEYRSLWANTIEDMIQALDRYRDKALAHLRSIDAEMAAARHGNTDAQKGYDQYDRMLVWLTGHIPLDQVAQEAATKVPQVTVNVPQQQAAGAPAQSDIERAPCPRCHEMIAATATYCYKCELSGAGFKAARKAQMEAEKSE